MTIQKEFPTEDSSPKDQRKYDRRHSIYYLRVYDKSTGSLLGNLIDISEKGLMLISDNTLEINKVFTCSMHLPEEIEGSNTVDFELESRWCRNDTNPNFYDVGFKVISAPDAFYKILNHLIAAYMFKDID